MEEGSLELALPGFRFHPTEEELLDFYLRNVVFGKKLCFNVIDYLNIYKYDPRELPGLAKIGEREWYFFVPRDRKHGSGGRPNRTTQTGFWKATGSDRRIVSLSDHKRLLGLRKTLVFYEGRAPKGCKTDWVMNEYRLPDNSSLPKEMVLCKIYRKATSLKVLEQRAAMEEGMKTNSTPHPSQYSSPPSPFSPMDTTTSSFNSHQDSTVTMPNIVLKQEQLEGEGEEREEQDFTSEDRKMINAAQESQKVLSSLSRSSLQLPSGQERLPDLQVPKISADWTQDSFWTQLNSPWLQNLNFCTNILNF